MDDMSKQPQPKTAREQRLAEALKRNISRRKAAAKQAIDSRKK
jgi:hypothetical protein